MKIRYEVPTYLGKVRPSFNLATTSASDPQTRNVSHKALAIALIVAVVLLANATGILPSVIQIAGLLFGRR